jgi:hypothetical protein
MADDGLGAALRDADSEMSDGPPGKAVHSCTVVNLHVQVVNRQTKDPIGEVEVKAQGGASLDAATSDDGWVRFDRISPGTYSVSALLGALEEDYQKPPAPHHEVGVTKGTVETKIELVPRKLHIVGIDDHFAPQAELLDIVYEIGGLTDKEVTYRIRDREGTLIFERTLDDGERADGDRKPLTWDGVATNGDRAGRHATPLMAPFKVELYATERYKDETRFKILYHSLKMLQGPWTPDEEMPPDSDERAWTAWQLNALGYWGGPVGKDFDHYLDKAIIRYKANHSALHRLKYRDYDAAITPELKTALAAGDAARDAVIGDAVTNPGGSSRLRVEEITYESGEFGKERGPLEVKRVNRPLLPIEVKIYLKSKSDAAADAPDAVGPVRIDWRFRDGNEDLSTQVANTPAEPSKTAAYLEKALKLKGGRSGRGDNCPKELGGIREADATNYRTPFVLGALYTPYTTKDDGGDKVVYVNAWDDNANNQKRLGRAGLFFHPSFIGGDDYKLRAEIDFKDRPNKAELEKFHNVTSPDNRIHADSGTFTVWRSAAIAGLVEWPTRNSPPATFGSHEWDKIAKEFEHAFIDLDIGSLTTLPITDAIDEPTYKNIVARYTMFTDKTKIHLEPDAMIGVELPRQGISSARTYKAKLAAFSSAMFDALNGPLRREFSKKLRPTYPSGFFITTFFVHKPVNIETAPAKGDHSVTADNAGFITWASSIGLEDSMIFYDMKDPDQPYYVASHEMGHNFYLLHWENTGEANWSHHDLSDHNCTMSYSSSIKGKPAHQKPGTYTPHFCGKCNMKLRGWKITSGLMPAK